MTVIKLTTKINAPVNRCFDLARSIDFHVYSMRTTNERPVSGVIAGLIGKGQAVTWEARHFGLMQKLTSEITEMIPGKLFIDEMIRGPFKKIKHLHRFETNHEYTIVNDEFEYEVPHGWAGTLFNLFFLKRYMRKLLIGRNQKLKEAAESDDWKLFLK